MSLCVFVLSTSFERFENAFQVKADWYIIWLRRLSIPSVTSEVTTTGFTSREMFELRVQKSGFPNVSSCRFWRVRWSQHIRGHPPISVSYFPTSYLCRGVVLMFCEMLDMLDMLDISAMRSITPARLPHSAELEAMRLVAGRQPDGVEVGSMGHCSSIALGLSLRHCCTCSWLLGRQGSRSLCAWSWLLVGLFEFF